MRRLLGVFGLAMLLAPSPALAQEEGKIGVTMGFPSSIGVLWHLTEKVAIRPELGFAWSSSESEFGDSDGFNLSTGLSALFYLKRSDDLATYFTPRYAFTHSTSERRFEGAQFIEPLIESTTRSHHFSGSFGVQYFMGSRFSVFGELGLAYQRATSDTDVDDDEPSSSTFGTRSGVGIVFYF